MKKIEKVLGKISKDISPHLYEEHLIEFFQAMCVECDLISKVTRKYESFENLISLAFSENNSHHAKSFIACCLLRLLCTNGDVVWKVGKLRFRVFQFFDVNLQKVYTALKIKQGFENHKKYSILRDTEKAVLNDFSNITNTMVSLRTVAACRKQYMKALNSYPGKFLFDHFIDPALIGEERLSELFYVLDNYYTSPVRKKLDSFVEIRRLFKQYISDAKKCKSIFCAKCILEPWNKVYDIIESDLKRNDAIKPANVSVKGTDRLYPLHMPGAEILWKFLVINDGPGYAFDVSVEIVDQEGLEITAPIISVGQLEVGKTERYAKAVVKNKTNSDFVVIGKVFWTNFDRSEGESDFFHEITSQRTDLDWEKLETEKPYSLEAVETEEELVGRKEVIESLYAKLTSNQLESSIIWGQKRVGKTSIAKTLQTKLEKEGNYTTVYIAVGDLDKTSAHNFVSTLGSEIVESIALQNPAFSKIDQPVFNSSLSPLLKYLRRIEGLFCHHQFAIIIDEFDEIPRALYFYTDIGDAFFHNIRSLSSENYLGFVFVGGENIKTIKQATDRLNKFESFRVDYFDKEKHWKDFEDLVRRPVAEKFEIKDRAIESLYSITEGNPFFTKYVCGRLYLQACSHRNAFIAVREVEEAKRDLLKNIDINNINHFWKDGIFEPDPAKRDIIETQRRKFMIGYAGIKQSKNAVTKDDLKKLEYLARDVSIDKMLESFLSRGVIVEENGSYRFKPYFFDLWLVDTGSKLLSSDFLDEETIQSYKITEKESFVTDSEIADLSEKWGLYRGAKITPQHIRRWLDQFDGFLEKRLMYKLLQRATFYDEGRVREKMRIIHDAVKPIVQYISIGERVRKDFILSSFGQLTKSSTSCARIYCSENKLSVDNIVSFDRIWHTLEKRKDVQAFGFIDDIIGSGETVSEFLSQLNRNYGRLIAEGGIKVVVAAICGLDSSYRYIRSSSSEYEFEVDIHISDILTDSDQCFSAQNDIFNSTDERNRAKEIARYYGLKLHKKYPLGYNDGQLLIVFHDNCPDNSLPVLWASGNSNLDWKPLFKRS